MFHTSAPPKRKREREREEIAQQRRSRTPFGLIVGS
jgi:hypothetical protein